MRSSNQSTGYQGERNTQQANRQRRQAPQSQPIPGRLYVGTRWMDLEMSMLPLPAPSMPLLMVLLPFQGLGGRTCCCRRPRRPGRWI